MIDFKYLLEEINLDINDLQLEQFKIYQEFLVEYNEKVNLTAITDKEEIYIKHFYDSLLVSKMIDLNDELSIADIGSGAGFPSIPLKIMFPNLKVTIVDALEKRLVFLKELCNKLNIKDVNLVHSRAEDFKDGKEKFDLVLTRALGRQSMVNEFCIPLTKLNGYYISMKGSNYKEELEEGNSLKLLGGKVEEVKEFFLPNDLGERALIKIKHIEKTPNKYPRKFNLIKNNPL